MNIELLVVPNCPNAQPAAHLLRTVLDDMGLHDVAFTTRVIADQAEAESAAFTGSPTILIDGRDAFAEPGRVPGLTCRVYRNPDGLAGAPAADQVRQALTAAL
ncbi:hypothetical protein Sipo8835_45090 [Streptomyces ipomoeae]|jgi:hypothetical protein|uniref:Alkylmercury lyase n=2 Tax=Streptomyces ipomoeae TaxID=103232 RepID=L1KYB8_9ACTN|nr:hypothetical protein [Streptomyces ipomoeae]EKX65328.1 hypothetical protein STRIP9103_04343 [Streptomyces ipomoeae 91-03]MDX2698246.1 hypothetical protein [Streptomyces ipomoeae]MDX2823886.1 hypothetical protein [Streptomyces ipomoeae]MDX2840747.1 hypothetical protein [Streptomyces ipomoeae]MDX2876508.1 hypothetical protein [Streptomyces ipomoeae]